MSTAQQAPLQHKQTSDLKAILKLTGPILLTQLAQVGMGTIDTKDATDSTYDEEPKDAKDAGTASTQGRHE